MSINIDQNPAPRQPSSYDTAAVLDAPIYIAVRQSWNGGSWSLDTRFMGESPDDVWAAVYLDESTKLGQTYRQVYGAVIRVEQANIMATVRPQDCHDIPELNADPFQAAELADSVEGRR